MRPINNLRTPKRPNVTPRNRSPLRDPVEVYCRLRPINEENELPCVQPVSSTVVKLVPPDNYVFKYGCAKEVQYSFKCVFGEYVDQKELFDHVALPLIEDLLLGKNALLFTYGITSSGKTYTMTGVPDNCGLLPRTFDVIFNSISNVQTKKYIVKPDKMNGFEIQNSYEASVDSKKDAVTKTPKPKKKEDSLDWNVRIHDITQVGKINSENVYGVFVSYTEIYNNYVYDLLEDVPIDPLKPKTLQSKMLREDAAHNMYVFNASEMEVKTSEEALQCFCKGQQRRRVAHTALNTESSRSHSVFNIKVVQIPASDSHVQLQDRNYTIVSQLSLVDLAGSERTGRTKNCGDRLREAGNINNSLMVLRNCIEILRENQTQGTNKMVPYRESKLTHLFKTFFEGEGKVRMIVCVNPRADNYEEMGHVLRFAEMTQEVLITKPTPVATPVVTGLRSATGLRSNLNKVVQTKGKEKDEIYQQFFSARSPFPNFEIHSYNDAPVLENLIRYLQDRKSMRELAFKNWENKCASLRNSIIDTEKENISLHQQNHVALMDLEAREQQVKALESRLSSSELEKLSMQRKTEEFKKNISSLETKIADKDKLLQKAFVEKERSKTLLKDTVSQERERLKNILGKRFALKQAELESKLSLNEGRMRQLKDILNSGDDGWDFFSDVPTEQNIPQVRVVKAPPASSTASEVTKTGTIPSGVQCVDSENRTPLRPLDSVENTQSKSQRKPPPVSNIRHRRSNSADVWLEHKPTGSIELNTVLQPKMKSKKSVSKLDVKDMTKDVSKYVLTHQEQGSQGDVETCLYKGDVIKSVCGGAQVVFSDVEQLKQLSPQSSNIRKRPTEAIEQEEIESRCAVGIEYHSKSPSISKKPRF